MPRRRCTQARSAIVVAVGTGGGGTGARRLPPASPPLASCNKPVKFLTNKNNCYCYTCEYGKKTQHTGCTADKQLQAKLKDMQESELMVEKPERRMQSVTGCMQKGDEPGEFSITGEDGKTWGLHSKTVKLDDHLGHKVTVTGSPIHESAAKEKAEEKKEGKMEKAASKEEIGDLHVTSVKMISESCNK